VGIDECEECSMAKKGKFKDLLKALFSGIIGAGIFFLFAVFAFSMAKIVYTLMERDFIISKYNILFALLMFVVFGFAYGMSCYIKKNTYRKMLKPNWISILITIGITAIFLVVAYQFIRNRFGLLLGYKSIVLLSIIFLACFYLFSAVLSNYFVEKKKRVRGHHARNALALVLFNPFFVLAYIWLFLMVAYNSVYVPCNVEILGVEDNIYTSNTMNLGIEMGERIISIDGVKVDSVHDIKRYMNSLESTKQVILETDKQLYYIRTYKTDNNRYMGLFLRQDYCVN
jgi:hypothetical protein